MTTPEHEPRDTMWQAGIAGHINGYDVLITGDTLYVEHVGSGRCWQRAVPNYGTSLGDLARRPGFRLGWGRFPDDAEVLYCYDRDDDNFGCAYNLSDPMLSEWGYAPFTRSAY